MRLRFKLPESFDDPKLLKLLQEKADEIAKGYSEKVVAFPWVIAETTDDESIVLRRCKRCGVTEPIKLGHISALDLAAITNRFVDEHKTCEEEDSDGKS